MAKLDVLLPKLDIIKEMARETTSFCRFITENCMDIPVLSLHGKKDNVYLFHKHISCTNEV